MQHGISDRIDFLMRVTGTSNVQLARALNFDASYISRIRAGKRGLPPELPFIEPAAIFFARNVSEGYQTEAIAHELGLPGKWPADKSKAARLIAKWLECAEREDSHHVQLESPGDEAVDDGLQSATGRLAEARLFFGEEGHREASLAFLKNVVNAGKPCDLLLQSDEDTTWMYRDASFVKEWSDLMESVASIGCTLVVVHTISRAGNEMWEGLREWLPLYLTGAIRPYYYPRLRDGVRARTLFVARGMCALVSNSVQEMGSEGLCIMLDDPDAVSALEHEFDAYLKLCSPLAQTERLQSTAEFESLIGAYRNADNVVAAEIAGALVFTRIGHEALVASSDKSLVYRIDEPRLVNAIASFATHAPGSASDASAISALIDKNIG